jgi:hypothetical protein
MTLAPRGAKLGKGQLAVDKICAAALNFSVNQIAYKAQKATTQVIKVVAFSFNY